MEQISISNLDPMIQTGLSKTTKRRDSWSEGIMKWVEWDAFDGKGRNVMQFSTVQSSFSFLLDCKEVSERNKIASYVVRNTHYERIFKWDEARNRVLKRQNDEVETEVNTFPHLAAKYTNIYNKSGHIGIYDRSRRASVLERYRKKRKGIFDERKRKAAEKLRKKEEKQKLKEKQKAMGLDVGTPKKASKKKKNLLLLPSSIPATTNALDTLVTLSSIALKGIPESLTNDVPRSMNKHSTVPQSREPSVVNTFDSMPNTEAALLLAGLSSSISSEVIPSERTNTS